MKHFLNDKDGLSARDYLLIISTSIFFIFVVVGLILDLIGHEFGNMYLPLLDMIAPVVMTIVGSVAGVDITEKITNRKKDKKEDSDIEESHTASQYKDDINKPTI